MSHEKAMTVLCGLGVAAVLITLFIAHLGKWGQR